jgi:hypothetical protein
MPFAAGCTGDASVPGAAFAPTAIGANPSPSAGATITGTAKVPGSGSFGLSLRTALVPSGLVVRVAGTSIQATADGSGRFTLEGVPPGDVELVFEGAGINASLVLSDVESDEEFTIVVVLNGNSAELEDDSRDDDSADEDPADDDDSVDDDSVDDDSADDSSDDADSEDEADDEEDDEDDDEEDDEEDEEDDEEDEAGDAKKK